MFSSPLFIEYSCMCYRKCGRTGTGCRADCLVGERVRSRLGMCWTLLNHTEFLQRLVLPESALQQALVMEVPTDIFNQVWWTSVRKVA